MIRDFDASMPGGPYGDEALQPRRRIHYVNIFTRQVAQHFFPQALGAAANDPGLSLRCDRGGAPEKPILRKRCRPCSGSPASTSPPWIGELRP